MTKTKWLTRNVGADPPVVAKNSLQFSWAGMHLWASFDNMSQLSFFGGEYSPWQMPSPSRKRERVAKRFTSSTGARKIKFERYVLSISWNKINERSTSGLTLITRTRVNPPIKVNPPFRPHPEAQIEITSKFFFLSCFVFFFLS